MTGRMISAMIVVSTLAVVAGDGCTSPHRITRRSELADPLETGEITVLTKGGSRYELGNYRVTDSTLIGSGILNVEKPTPFAGEIRWPEIAYIQTTNFNFLKTVLALGIVGFGVSTFGNDFEVEQKRTYHGPTGGSCPYVYSYDGTMFHLESETFAGAVFKGAERTTYDRLNHLAPVDGSYRIKIANERPESEYTNQFTLLAVDAHPAVIPIPDADGTFHTVGSPLPPDDARGLDGSRCLPLIREADRVYWESDISTREFTSTEALRDGMILEFPKPEGSEFAKLIVRGVNTALGVFAFEQLFQMKGKHRLEWYRRLESDPAESQKLLGFIKREGMLHISLLVNGEWKEAEPLFDVGPVVPKEQLIVLDVRACSGNTLSVRIEAAVDLWRIDQVAVDYSVDLPVSVRELTLERAVDETGRDLRQMLLHDDALYYGSGQGQSAILSYPALPANPGQRRSLFARAKGYYHQWFAPDGDDQTALLERVLAEPQFGGKLLMAKWRVVRQTHPSHPDQ